MLVEGKLATEESASNIDNEMPNSTVDLESASGINIIRKHKHSSSRSESGSKHSSPFSRRPKQRSASLDLSAKKKKSSNSVKKLQSVHQNDLQSNNASITKTDKDFSSLESSNPLSTIETMKIKTVNEENKSSFQETTSSSTNAQLNAQSSSSENEVANKEKTIAGVKRKIDFDDIKPDNVSSAPSTLSQPSLITVSSATTSGK